MIEPDISAIPREARPYQGVPAGVVTRVLASVIDAVVVGAILVSWYVGLAGFLFIIDPRGFSPPSGSPLRSMAVVLSVLIGYLTLCWWLTGRSYGNHVMGLRVVGGRGQRLRLPRALARAAFCALFPIGLFWCAVSPARRSVQDLLLRTAVIYDWMPEAVTKARGGRRLTPVAMDTDARGQDSGIVDTPVVAEEAGPS